MKRSIKEYYEKLYANDVGNLDEMRKVLETYQDWITKK